MKLLKAVNDAIWAEFNSYDQVRFYLSKWHENNYEPNAFNNNYWENFTIVEKENKKIDLLATLNSMTGTLLIKVAIDLGVETPDFIPSIPTFKNELKSEYKTAYDTFTKALNKLRQTQVWQLGLQILHLKALSKRS